MITRLKARFPTHNIVSENSPKLYLVDHKHINGGPVTIANIDPALPHVFIANENEIPIYFDGFPENAFVVTPGIHLNQCECIMFPQSCGIDDWILAVETKYVSNMENAFRASNDYPKSMINQVVSTVNHLRDIGVILKDKTVNAIVSFPTLIEDFGAFFFSGTPSIEDIFFEHRIKIRASSFAIIKNNRKIRI
jgi:hypothetical protein